MHVANNHRDPLKKQTPLAVRLRDLSNENKVSVDCMTVSARIPTSSSDPIILALRTDSAHLAQFFTANWPATASDVEPDATIVALKNNAESYGCPSDLDGSRWFCPNTRQVWMFGNEFYGNIKITVRGLCSELAPLEDTFLHGCALASNGTGLLLAGMSGAGKTTIASLLLHRHCSSFQVVNDDWGACSLITGALRSTGEPHLHMKYPSVRTLAPHLQISPERYLSENFTGDVNDPRARLLIAPAEVFGEQRLVNDSVLGAFVVIMRDHERPFGIRQLTIADVPMLEQGQYSRFYSRTEWFLNGSLFILDEDRRRRERRRHEMLLSRIPSVCVNNVATPEDAVGLILESLQVTTSIRM